MKGGEVFVFIGYLVVLVILFIALSLSMYKKEKELYTEAEKIAKRKGYKEFDYEIVSNGSLVVKELKSKLTTK